MQINIVGDLYLWDDFVFVICEGLVLELKYVIDLVEICKYEVDVFFYVIEFNFNLLLEQKDLFKVDINCLCLVV